MTTAPGEASTLELPAIGSSVSLARRFVTSALRERGLEQLCDDAALAVSELVTNAVLHARTQVDVTVRTGGPVVEVAVGDLAPYLPALRSFGALATTGRGLAVVASLSSDRGVRPREVGKVVWFTLAADATTTAPDDGGWSADGADPAAVPAVPPADEGFSAVLVGVPVALWAVTRRHEEAALRELVLYRGQRIAPTVEAWAWFRQSDTAHVVLSDAIEAALATSDGTPTVTVRLPASDDLVTGLQALDTALADADDLAAAGDLLIHPTPAPGLALRRWYVGQLLRQQGGAAAEPWADPV
jgi:anti-sigma regulatory factor (Ser/Thr protein kinase)